MEAKRHLPDELSSLNWIDAIMDQSLNVEGTLLAGKIGYSPIRHSDIPRAAESV